MKQCVNYDIFRYTIKMQTYYENFLKSTTHVVLTTSIIYIESRINFPPVVYRKILADMNICKIFRKSQFSYDTLGSRALTVLNYNSMEMKIIYHNFGCIVNKMSLIVKKIYGTKKVTNLKMPIFFEKLRQRDFPNTLQNRSTIWHSNFDCKRSSVARSFLPVSVGSGGGDACGLYIACMRRLWVFFACRENT